MRCGQVAGCLLRNLRPSNHPQASATTDHQALLGVPDLIYITPTTTAALVRALLSPIERAGRERGTSSNAGNKIALWRREGLFALLLQPLHHPRLPGLACQGLEILSARGMEHGAVVLGREAATKESTRERLG